MREVPDDKIKPDLLLVCGIRVLALPFLKSARKGKKKRITTCSGVSSSSSSQEGRKKERRTSSLPPAI